MAEPTASVFPEAAEPCWGCGGQLTESSPDCSNRHHPVPAARTPCHSFDDPCDYTPGGRCRNHGGIIPDPRLAVATAIADAAGDGAFDDIRDTDPEMWDAREEDRDYWLRLADAALAILPALPTGDDRIAVAGDPS